SGGRTGGGNRKTSKVARPSGAGTSSRRGARTSTGRTGAPWTGGTSGAAGHGRGWPASRGAGQDSRGAGQDSRGGRGGAPRTSSGEGARRSPRAPAADGGTRWAPRPA